jgi:hypothetical protein
MWLIAARGKLSQLVAIEFLDSIDSTFLYSQISMQSFGCFDTMSSIALLPPIGHGHEIPTSFQTDATECLINGPEQASL